MMGRRSAQMARSLPVPGHLGARPVYTGPVPRGLADSIMARRPSLGVVGPESVPGWDSLSPEQKAAAARNLVTVDQCRRIRCGLISAAEAGPAAGLCALGYPDMAGAPSSPCDNSCSPYWAEVWHKFGMGCDDGPPRTAQGVEKKLPAAPPRVPVETPTAINTVYHPVLYPSGPYVLPSWDLPGCMNPDGCSSAAAAVAQAPMSESAGSVSPWWWLVAGLVVGVAVDGGHKA